MKRQIKRKISDVILNEKQKDGVDYASNPNKRNPLLTRNEVNARISSAIGSLGGSPDRSKWYPVYRPLIFDMASVLPGVTFVHYQPSTNGRYIATGQDRVGGAGNNLMRVDTLDFTTSGVTVLDVATLGLTPRFFCSCSDGIYAYFIPGGFSPRKICRVLWDDWTLGSAQTFDLATVEPTINNSESAVYYDNHLYIACKAAGKSGIIKLNTQDFLTWSYLDLQAVDPDLAYFRLFVMNGSLFVMNRYTEAWATNQKIAKVDIATFTVDTIFNPTLLVPSISTDRSTHFKADNQHVYVCSVSQNLWRVPLATLDSVDVIPLSSPGLNFSCYGTVLTDDFVYTLPFATYGIMVRAEKQNFTASGLEIMDLADFGLVGNAKGWAGAIHVGDFLYFGGYNSNKLMRMPAIEC